MNSSHLSIAGKVFLLGEYAVLMGLPALVATVGPRFQMKVSLSSSWQDSRRAWPERSPLGRLLQWAESQGVEPLAFEFLDPLQGAGGLGASTAQFAMAYQAISQSQEEEGSTAHPRRWPQVLRLYRELMSDEPIIPSGADLVAQWQGGVTFFDPSQNFAQDVWALLGTLPFIIFSTTATHSQRKVPTHEHLRDLAERGILKMDSPLVSALKSHLMQAMSALEERDFQSFAQAFQSYGNTLGQYDLETQATREDKKVLLHLPDVLAVKGAGALQSDGIIVLMKPGSLSHDHVIEAAKERGLTLLVDGLTCQMGVSCPV